MKKKSRLSRSFTCILLTCCLLMQMAIPSFAAEDTEDITSIETSNQINLIYMSGSDELDPGIEIACFTVPSNDITNTLSLENTIHTIEDWQSYVTKPNYNFLGWKWAVWGGNLSDDFITDILWTPDEDMFLYAQYEYTTTTEPEYNVIAKDYLMGNTLGALTVTGGAILSQSEIEISAPIINDYTFIGWSTDPDATECPSQITVNGDTFIYAIYEFSGINTGEIDTDYIIRATTAAEAYSSLLDKFGISKEEVLSLPKREAAFYEYLNNYTNNILAQMPNTQNARSMSEDFAESMNGKRMAYAVECAKWSMPRRPDYRNMPKSSDKYREAFNKEVAYMFMSHYIDVPNPFSGDNVAEHSEGQLLAKWITDYCRNDYDEYFKRGNNIEWLQNILKATAMAADSKMSISALENAETNVATLLPSIAANGITAKDILTRYNIKHNRSILKAIAEIQALDETEFINKMKILQDELEDDLALWYDDLNGEEITSLVFATFGSVCAMISGGGVFAILLPFAGFYIDTYINLINRANWVAMRSYVRFRVGKRTYYYWGISDGKN